MVKAIFFDVDGTLLRFNEETIPDSILDSLRCLKNSGIKVFVASGRSYAQIKRVTDFPFDGFVASNGAVGIDAEGKVLYKSSIPYIDLFNLVQYLESTSSGFCISYMTEEGVFGIATLSRRLFYATIFSFSNNISSICLGVLYPRAECALWVL